MTHILKPCLSALLASLLFVAGSARADVYDDDTDARWDVMRFTTNVLKFDQALQGFEAGFVDRQALAGWIPVGNGNAVRFGFSDSLKPPQRPAYIARTGAPYTAFSNDQPRGTLAGTYFLTDEATSPPQQSPRYFFMEFKKPLTGLAFAMYDLNSTTATPITATVHCLTGTNPYSATEVSTQVLPVTNGSDVPVGNISFFLATPSSSTSATFNQVFVELSQPDASIAFDNLIVRTAP